MCAYVSACECVCKGGGPHVAAPEVIDHIGHTEEGQHKGAWPAVALPDEITARVPGLLQTLLCHVPIQFPMIPPGMRKTMVIKGKQ